MNTLVVIVVIAVIIPQSFAAVAEWGTWSACTKSCGGGTRARTAVCTGNGKCVQNDGKINEGQNETQSCNTAACETSTTTSQPKTTTQPITTNEQATSTKQVTSNNEQTDTNPITSPDTTTNSKQTQQTTKQESSAPERTDIDTKTNAPKQTEPAKDEAGLVFEGEMTMKKTFTDDLKDSNSKAFKELKNKIETQMSLTFSKEGIESEVYKFTPGSVIVHYRMRAKRSVSSTKVHGMLSTSIASGPMSSLSISAFTIDTPKSPIPDEELNFSTTSEEVVKPYLYFLYGFGGMIGLALLFIAVGCTKKKVKPAPEEVAEEDDYEAYFKTPTTEKKWAGDDFKIEPVNDNSRSSFGKGGI